MIDLKAPGLKGRSGNIRLSPSQILSWGSIENKVSMMERGVVTQEQQLRLEAGRPRASKARIGVFNVGFHRDWPQFPGLRERLDSYREKFEKRLECFGVDVVSAGLVDTVESGRRAGDFFATQNVELVFCFVTTYVQSGFALPVAQRSKTRMVLVGLQPTAGMDTSTATTYEQLAHDNCTSLPEIAYALKRAGLETDVIFGMLDDDQASLGRKPPVGPGRQGGAHAPQRSHRIAGPSLRGAA